MKKTRLILLAMLMIISSLTFAQEKVKVGGFVQGLYQVDVHDNDNIDNSFRMRRVRLAVSGDLNKVISYKIQGDFSSVPTMVDAYVKAKFCDAFAVQFGQFKLPFSIESPLNPVDLEAVDYGDVISKLVGYSDVCGVGQSSGCPGARRSRRPAAAGGSRRSRGPSPPSRVPAPRESQSAPR